MTNEIIIVLAAIALGFLMGFLLGRLRNQSINNLSSQIAEIKARFEEIEKARNEIQKQRERIEEEKEKRFREFMENIHNLFRELSERSIRLDEEKEKRIRDLMEQTKRFFEEQKRHTEQFLIEQGKSKEEIEKRRDAQLQDMKNMISMFIKTISGTKTRGITGEVILKDALKESIKAGVIKCNLKTDNGEIEFAWDLGDGKYIPIDSKMPDVTGILERYNKEDGKQEEYKKEVLEKMKKEIKRVQKYQNLSNTIDSCILVVPEAVLDIAPELVSIGRQSNVFICSYKDVFPVAHLLQDQYIRLKEEGDIGKYKQIIKTLFQILDNISVKTDSIEKALTTIKNANEKIKTEIIKGKRAKEYISED